MLNFTKYSKKDDDMGIELIEEGRGTPNADMLGKISSVATNEKDLVEAKATPLAYGSRYGSYEQCVEAAQLRKDQIEKLTTVSTFLAGFALQDLSSFDQSNWYYTDDSSPLRIILSVMYPIFMAFTVGVSAYISIVGIVLITTMSRLQEKDVRNCYIKKDSGHQSNVTPVKDAVGMIREDVLNKVRKKKVPMTFVFMNKVADYAHWCGKDPWRIATGNDFCIVVLLFPWAVFSYILAVGIKVMVQLAGRESAISNATALGISLILLVFGILMTFHAKKFLKLAIH